MVRYDFNVLLKKMSHRASSRTRFHGQSKSNVLNNVTTFSQLGLSFYESDDNVIETGTQFSQDGRRILAGTVQASRPLEVRTHTHIDTADDWSNFNIYTWDDEGHSLPESFAYQVKNGRVTKVRHRRLYASVRPHHLSKMCSHSSEYKTGRTVQCKLLFTIVKTILSSR
jgi:hypothetical protein